MKRLLVVGAGLGGLAVSLRLARRGFSVTLLEKNDRVGGKLNIWREKGYTFDTGPTLLTMPFVLEDLFDSLGLRLRDHLELVRIDPLCRYSYGDGSRIDATSDLKGMEREIAKLSAPDADGFRRFMRHAAGIYDAAAEPFLFSPFISAGFRGLIANLANLPALFRIDAFRSMNSAVSEYFEDERLRQLFNRFATYNGSSPYLAPATLAIIPHVEFAMGGWYVKGGMYRIAEIFQKLALDLGVLIRTGVEVTGFKQKDHAAVGVDTKDHGFIPADGVIANADAMYVRETLMEGGAGVNRGVEPSLGGFVMMLGVRREFPQLIHHNIFFSSDYRKEFDSLVNKGRPAGEPTVYVALSCKTDTVMAPPDSSNLFILVNTPPLGDRWSWEAEGAAYRSLVLGRLREHGVAIDEKEIEVERIITPADFARRYNAYRGSIYGTSSNSRSAAFLRPPNRSRELKNLFFVGGSTHPGGGIPLVLLSARNVSRLAGEQWS
jgi:phytoene desaturase